MNSDSNNTPSGGSFLRKGSTFMLLDNLTKSLDPLLVLMCAKFYAGGDWGSFKYYESIVLLLLRFSTTGMDHAVIWIYSRCRDEADFMRRFSRTLNFALALCVVFAAGALAQYKGYLPGGHFAKGMDVPTGEFVLYLAALPAQVAAFLLVQALINKRSLMAGLWVRNIAVPFGIYGLAALLFFTPARGTALALGYFFGNMAGLAVAWIAAMRVFGRSGGWSFSPAIPREVFGYILPISLSGSLMSLANRFDILFLAKFAGPLAVEVYSIVQMVANTMSTLRSSLVNVMLSLFSGGGKGKRMDSERREHFDYATWLVMAMQLPFLAFAFLFAKDLLPLLGPTYAVGTVALCVAMTFTFFNTSIAFTELLLLGMGRSVLVSIAQIAFFILSLSLNLLLIPRYGTMGAVIAIGTGQFSMYLTCAIGVSMRGGGWFFTGKLVRELALSIAFFIPALLLSFSWPVSHPSLWLRAGVFIASLSAYAAFGWKTYKAWHERIESHSTPIKSEP